MRVTSKFRVRRAASSSWGLESGVTWENSPCSVGPHGLLFQGCCESLKGHSTACERSWRCNLEEVLGGWRNTVALLEKSRNNSWGNDFLNCTRGMQCSHRVIQARPEFSDIHNVFYYCKVGFDRSKWNIIKMCIFYLLLIEQLHGFYVHSC